MVAWVVQAWLRGLSPRRGAESAIGQESCLPQRPFAALAALNHGQDSMGA
jgi:hypothetical protein